MPGLLPRAAMAPAPAKPAGMKPKAPRKPGLLPNAGTDTQASADALVDLVSKALDPAASKPAAEVAAPETGEAPKGGLLAREAARVQAAGRDGDTILAHINPAEADMLRAAGGRGTENPKTGLLEFANQSNFDAAYYLSQNPDVAAAGVDPWQHYQQHGQNEGRVATQEESSARAEGYTGLFGKPESGTNYVDWKASQGAPAPDPAPTTPAAGSASGEPESFNSLPGSGKVRNLKLPNGSTIQIREDDPSFAEVMSRGAVDQDSPEAANYSSESWYAPGGQGYLDAMRDGHNDPNSDPNNPQPFSDAALTAAGIDPATYRSANAPQSGGITDWGGRDDLNKNLYGYLQSQGYNPDFAGFGGGIANNFGNWLAGQTAEVQADVNAWLDANDPSRRANGAPASGAPKTTEQRVSDILAAESPLMRRAASQGQMLANRRGLLNSSVASEAAMAAMIDAAVPIASNDAGLENQRYLQQQDIANQRAMQAADIGSKNWQAQLDADTRTRIASMQVATADKDKIGALVSNIQAQHTSRINNIVSNPEIPAETRAQYLADADTWMRNQLDMLEGMYGVQLDWAA